MHITQTTHQHISQLPSFLLSIQITSNPDSSLLLFLREQQKRDTTARGWFLEVILTHFAETKRLPLNGVRNAEKVENDEGRSEADFASMHTFMFFVHG